LTTKFARIEQGAVCARARLALARCEIADCAARRSLLARLSVAWAYRSLAPPEPCRRPSLAAAATAANATATATPTPNANTNPASAPVAALNGLAEPLMQAPVCLRDTRPAPELAPLAPLPLAASPTNQLDGPTYLGSRFVAPPRLASPRLAVCCPWRPLACSRADTRLLNALGPNGDKLAPLLPAACLSQSAAHSTDGRAAAHVLLTIPLHNVDVR